MIANYGYEDGTGEYFISIDTDKCLECNGGPCVDSCPEEVFDIAEDDWGDDVACVSEGKSHLLQEVCANCKYLPDHKGKTPCQVACTNGAIAFSW